MESKHYSYIDEWGKTRDLLIDRLGYLDMKLSYGINGLSQDEYNEYKQLLTQQNNN